MEEGRRRKKLLYVLLRLSGAKALSSATRLFGGKFVSTTLAATVIGRSAACAASASSSSGITCGGGVEGPAVGSGDGDKFSAPGILRIGGEEEPAAAIEARCRAGEGGT